MSRKKIAIIAAAALVLVGVVLFSIRQSQKNVVTVQTGRVVRQDLTAVVTASGEIKPKTYVNLGANAFGKIVKLLVHEGDKVRKGQVVAQLESVQSAADVAAMRASLEANRTDAEAAAAGWKTAEADLARAKADAERTRLDFERAQGLYKDQLIAKADYDAKKAAYESADASLAEAVAHVAQAKAQKASADERIHQAQASLVRASDVLSKTSYVAPFDGLITNLPVREGETVVMGIQNSPGSTLMTIADMSVITAEVQVDETDIVSLRMGQPGEVSIDAIPGRTFKGHVTEIGNNAVVRSTGVSTAQSLTASQEAKDFKVVVTLDNPLDDLRPGLSATAKITTATRSSALTVPIQALTVRRQSELEERKPGTAQAAAPEKSAAKDKEKEIQGVFVVRKSKAVFVPVETGITGVTDIELRKGLAEGDEIVTGSYKALRSLRNGASVKVDNAPAKASEST